MTAQGYNKPTRIRTDYHHVLADSMKPGEAEHLQPRELLATRSSPASTAQLVTHLRPPHDHVHTLHDNWEATIAAHPHVPALGWRSRAADGQLGPYQWITYCQAGDLRTALGSGLLHLGTTPGSALGLYGINSKEWVLMDAAAHAYSLTSVPLYDTLGPHAVEYICNHADLAAVACSAEALPKLLDCLPRCTSVRLVVVWGAEQRAGSTELAALQWQHHPQAAVVLPSGQQQLPAAELQPPVQQSQLQQHIVLRLPAACQLLSYEELESLGRQHIHPHVPPSPDGVATICYTSGTTGLPKGAVLTHANLIANAAGNVEVQPPWQPGSRHISYLPLAHIFERKNLMVAVHYGCSIGFYSGDASKLLDDVAQLQPHMFMSVPRVYNRLYDAVMTSVKSASPQQQRLFEAAYQHRKAAMQAGDASGGLLGAAFDELVFNNIRQELGGRVQYMTTGASPISSEVLEFLRVCFGCPVLEGYGMTETSCTISIQQQHDVSLGHVGRPLPCCQVKLADVPELDYYTTDKPHPRGEVCVHGPVVFQGYQKDPQQTSEVMDEEGWFHTGDIGCWLPDGNLKLIDRKKNMFKLAQGEYVAPEKLEAVYMRSPFVQQCFVHGDSYRSQLVAVVVPDATQLQSWARQHRVKQDIGNLLSHPAAVQAVLCSMQEQGRLAHLQGFEQVAAVRLVPRPFTVDNGLVTPTSKLRRQTARQRFQQLIQEMYEALEEQQLHKQASRSAANWPDSRPRL